MADKLKLDDQEDRSGLFIGVNDIDEGRGKMQAGDGDKSDGDVGDDSDDSDGDGGLDGEEDGSDSDSNDGSGGDSSGPIRG